MIIICITYDDNFEPMCSHLCSNLLKSEGIIISLNKTEVQDDYKNGFRSKNWYSNLSKKMMFLREKIDEIEDNDVICCCDADIQFFKPEILLDLKFLMQSSYIEYTGQREGEKDEFNGGFFLLKKNTNTLKLLDHVNSTDLTKYKHAEQDVINEIIPKIGIKHFFLNHLKYLHGCMVKKPFISPKISEYIVMHHATCSYNALQKMDQMNYVRSALGFDLINWSLYTGIR